MNYVASILIYHSWSIRISSQLQIKSLVLIWELLLYLNILRASSILSVLKTVAWYGGWILQAIYLITVMEGTAKRSLRLKSFFLTSCNYVEGWLTWLMKHRGHLFVSWMIKFALYTQGLSLLTTLISKLFRGIISLYMNLSFFFIRLSLLCKSAVAFRMLNRILSIRGE